MDLSHLSTDSGPCSNGQSENESVCGGGDEGSGSGDEGSGAENELPIDKKSARNLSAEVKVFFIENIEWSNFARLCFYGF